ncbi:MAG: GGDEF domain-containing protein [Pseudomonadota bacterium]
MNHQPVVIVSGPTPGTADLCESLTGYDNTRFFNGAVAALQSLEETPAHLLVIEDDVDDMEPAEFAEMIRDIDREQGRFTYIVVRGNTVTPELDQAFALHVDAFVTKNDAAGLIRAITAGTRIAAELNDLLGANVSLRMERDVLLKGQLLDPLTGLGNRKLAEQALRDAIKQIESRGGAVCVLFLAIGNFAEIVARYDDKIGDETLVAVATRLHSLVRPMDVVTHYDRGRFVLVLLQPSIEHCSAECYQRIFDGVRLKSYRTSVGYIEPVVEMSICASHAENGAPNPERMFQVAEDNLKEAAVTQHIAVHHLVE